MALAHSCRTGESSPLPSVARLAKACGFCSRLIRGVRPLVILPETLVRRWRKEGITLLPPESPQAIVEAFARVGSIATRDVLEFYSEFGGMEPMDDGFLKIWSLSEILADNSERSEFGPLFADHLISCWSFRLKPIDAEISAVYVDHHSGSQPPELVANSLAEFLAIYERDPKAAHAW